MIYTRFGSKVEILDGNIQKCIVKIRRLLDGKIWIVHYFDLKADGGVQEIEKAINKIKQEGAK